MHENAIAPTNSQVLTTTTDNPAFRYRLLWRQRKLVIQAAEPSHGIVLPALTSTTWLAECLQRSPVTLITLDPNLGTPLLQTWADACHQAGKPVFLRLPSTQTLPQKKWPLGWAMKRLCDWLIAALILLLLSPVMLALAVTLAIVSPGPIFFYQWRVGKRGQLFKVIKFRTMIVGAEQLHQQVMGHQQGLHKLKDDPRITPLGRWMRKYSLDELPQLINVLRGEMSLVGPRPWALYDAIRIPKELHHRLNALPGITGAWQVQTRSTLLDLGTVNQGDLSYLHSWSIWSDFKFLLLTIPRVLSGFGAY